MHTSVWGCFLEYTNFKDDLIEYKCLCSNKNYQQVWRKSKGAIFKYIQITNHDNKFILLLQEGIYLYEYVGDWEKYHETSLP